MAPTPVTGRNPYSERTYSKSIQRIVEKDCQPEVSTLFGLWPSAFGLLVAVAIPKA